MSEQVKLQAADGQELAAYVARPTGAPVGAVVVVQEIFGVNAHIREVADRFAAAGYTAIAPALFDRIAPGTDLDYTPAGMQRAFTEFYPKLQVETALLDVAAAFKFVQGEGHPGVAVVGFCYGGLMSWLSATRGDTLEMRPACTVGYYAGGIGNFANEEPVCPVMLHFGGADSHIGPEQIEAVRTAHPEVTIYEYEGAKHAFNRDPDPNSYDPEAAKLAWERTMDFLKTNVA
jgi:carboxymethylenebutenolidase